MITTPTLRCRCWMAEQTADAEIDQSCRRLPLPSIRAFAADAVGIAQKGQFSSQGSLAELLLTECDDRDRHSSVRQLKAAGIPRDK